MTGPTLPELWRSLSARSRAEMMATPAGRITHGEMASLAERFCAAFDARGLRPGDRIVIASADEFVVVSAFIAALADGLVPVVLTPDTPPERAAAVAGAVQPAAVLVSATRCDEPWLGAMDRPFFLDVATRPKTGLFSLRKPSEAQRIALALALPEVGRTPRLPADGDGLAYLLFTSGTTQSPSGVVITRRNLFSNLATIARILEIGSDSRIFNDMVLAHADGMIQGPVMAFATGGCVVRAGGFSVQNLEHWLNEVRRSRATHFLTVPTVWTLIDRYAAHDDYFAESEFRHLGSVAAALDAQLWKRLEQRFKRPLTNQYGLTETVASALYAGPHEEAGAFGTVGRPVDCEARLGENGELQLRGDNVFAGYWQNADRTAETFTEDGWMRTGDLASARPDGSYEILGRLKTVIMSGGFLIRPEEIDEAMLSHPSVVQSVTFAMPDSVFDEVPMTAVVLDGSADEAALTAHARERLEPLKVPKRIVVLTAIPRGDAGKPRLDALRKEISARLAAPDGKGRRDSEEGEGLLAEILDVAADVFRVDRSVLSPRATPDTVQGWDSFTQISLIFALEDRFGVRIPPARASAIRSLAEAVAAVRAALT